MRKIGVFDRLRGVRVWSALCFAQCSSLVLCSGVRRLSSSRDR